MNKIEINEARDSLAHYARDVYRNKKPVVVTDHGKPVAALVSLENADDETVSLSTNAQFIALIERSRARHKTEGSISSEEMRRRFGATRKKP